MKRHFLTGLKAFAVGALAFAAVSCYDDQPIWDEILDLKGRVTALEEKLNSEVATINTTLGTLKAADEKLAADIAAVVADVKKVNETLTTLDAYDKTLDGKIEDLEAALAAFEDEATKQLAAAIAQIAVVKAEKNDAGNYVLTFADGKTLEVAAADANANNTGVITTVEVDGVTYWAVIGADGKTKVLDAAVHPDTKLEFKVDPETNELLVAYDGKTWEQTGVIVNDDTTFNVVTDFEDGEDYVTITVGGEEYQLPKYKADESVLELSRTEFYVMYGGSKMVELTVDGVEYYVMSKPDGWKVSIDETVLNVTAPSKTLVDLGAADTEGQVLVHATTAEGKCKVAKLDVKTGEAFGFTFANDSLHVFNAYTYEQTNMWGDVLVDFADMYIGIMPVSEFRAEVSFENMIQDIFADPEQTRVLGSLLGITGNQTEVQTWYEDGVYEVLDYNIALTDVASGAWPTYELDEEETYVVWMLPQDDKGYLYDYALYTVTGNVMKYEAVDSTYNNAVLSVDFFGADGYYVGATNKSYLEAFFGDWGMAADEILAYYLESGTMGGWGPPSGPFSKFLGGNMNAMGKFYAPGIHTINMKDVLLGDTENSPANEYFVWALPYYENKPLADYTIDDLYVYTCATKAMVKNDALAANVVFNGVSFTEGELDSLVFTVTPPANGVTVFEVFPVEDFEAEYYMDVDGSSELDEESLINWMKWNEPVKKEYKAVQTWGIEENVDYVIVTYTTVEGEYAFGMTEFTTKTEGEDEVELPTPNKAQWLFNNEYLESAMAPTNFVWDLGVSYPNNYSDYFPDPNTLVLGLDLETLYPDDETCAGLWSAAGLYGSYTIEATDEESGTIVFNGSAEIPYYDFTGETCTFDLSALFMEDEGTIVAECTLSEEELVVMAQ